MYRFADNVVETSTATTTGAYQLAGVPSGAEPGARTFVAGVGDGNSCDYYAKEVSGTAWERGIGTVTDAATDTLTRTAVHSSSNGGAAVDWTGKTVEISAVLPARRLATDHAGLVENLTITTSRAGNAETVHVKTLAGTDPSPTDPVRIAFNTTTGGFEVPELTTALSLTLSSGSTLGATSAQPFRIWLTVFNDAGTLRLGAIKCAMTDGVYGLQDNVPASSTAEGGAGAADSSGVIYTGTAVTSKVMRVLGYLEYTLTTAGTWDTAPSAGLLYSQGIRLPGEVVQRKLVVDTTTRSVTTAALSASGFSGAIALTAAPNAVNAVYSCTLGRNASGEVKAALYRGTTSLLASGWASDISNTIEGRTRIQSARAQKLDYPGATGAVTYNVYLSSLADGFTARLGRRDDNVGGNLAPTTLSLEEIQV